MFARVHTDSKTLNLNKSSCSDLVQYLNKENKGLNLFDQDLFFNSEDFNIQESEIINSIDNNVKGLGKGDYKFYMISINPDQKELKHLSELATGRKVNNINELSKKEFTKYQELFKNYVNNAMNDYAAAFNRDLTKNDLLYFAKIEQTREYKGFDQAVKEGRIKSGQLKEGLQTHAHIIVSRKTKDMSKKISPAAKSKGHSDKHKLNGKKVQVGFDNVNFKINVENTFDKQFGYNRDFYDKAYNKMTIKNADLYKIYGNLNNIETVLDKRKLINRTVNKTLKNSEKTKSLLNNARMAKSAVNVNSLKGLTLSTAAKSNPITAVAEKVYKIGKKAKNIIFDKGLDI